jgi:hypothetical protein
MSISRRFTWKAFGIRTAVALLLVLVTYNPFGPCATQAIISVETWNPLPMGTIFFALVVLAGWLLLFSFAFRHMGMGGSIVSGLLFAAFIGLGYSKGWFKPTAGVLEYLGILVFWAIGTIALNAAFIKRAVFGVGSVDDGDAEG